MEAGSFCWVYLYRMFELYTTSYCHAIFLWAFLIQKHWYVCCSLVALNFLFWEGFCCFVFYLKVNAGATNHLFGCCCCCHVTKKKQKFKKIKWLIAENFFFVLNTVVIAYPTSSFQKENKVYFKCSFANTLQTSCNLAQYTAPKN